jgi:hypothetical protein
MMPVISKSKRGNYYYNKMFKLNPKQKRKSAFFEGLMKAIEDIEKRKKKAKYSEENKLTFRKLYAKSKLELLKQRKEKYESYLSKKNKTLTNINNNINNNTNINNNINNIKPLRKSKSMIDQIKPEYKSASEKMVLKSFNRNKTRTDNFTNVSNLNEQNITIETLQTFNQNNESSRKSINKNLTNLDLAKLSTMHFEELSQKRFPCLAYAYETGKKGGVYPAVLNAANEASVRLFLARKIKFLDIEKIIKDYISRNYNVEATIDNILALDKEIQNEIYSLYGGK